MPISSSQSQPPHLGRGGGGSGRLPSSHSWSESSDAEAGGRPGAAAAAGPGQAGNCQKNDAGSPARAGSGNYYPPGGSGDPSDGVGRPAHSSPKFHAFPQFPGGEVSGDATSFSPNNSGEYWCCGYGGNDGNDLGVDTPPTLRRLLYDANPVLAPPPLPANNHVGPWMAPLLGGENDQHPCPETPRMPPAAENAMHVDERDLLSFPPFFNFGEENGQYLCPETPKKPSAAEKALLDADERDKENSPCHRSPGNARDLLSFSRQHGVTFWGADDLAGCPSRLERALAARDLYEQNAYFLFPALHPLGDDYSGAGPILPPFIFNTSLPPTAANMGLPEDCSPEVARRIADGWLLALKCRLFYLECPYHKNNDKEIDYYRRWVWSLVESGKDFGTVLALCGKPGNEVNLCCGAEEGCLKKYNACHSVKSAKKILAALRDLVQLDEHSRNELNMPNFRANCAWTLEDAKRYQRGSLSCPPPTPAEMWAKAAIINVMIWLCPKIHIGNILIDVSGTSKNNELLMELLDKHDIDLLAGPYDHLQGFETGRFPKAGDYAQNLSDKIVGYAKQREVKLTTTFAAEVKIEDLRRRCALHAKKCNDGKQKYHEMERIRKLPKRTPKQEADLAAYDAERAAKGLNIGAIRAKPEKERSTPERTALKRANQTNKKQNEANAAKRERTLMEIQAIATPDRSTPQRNTFDRTRRYQMDYFRRLGEERTARQTDALSAYNAEQATKDAEKEAEKKSPRRWGGTRKMSGGKWRPQLIA